MERLPPEYRKEPGEALTGGPDGLAIVRRIIDSAKPRLHALRCARAVRWAAAAKSLEAAYPDLEFTWLDTSAGADLVFLLERAQLPD